MTDEIVIAEYETVIAESEFANRSSGEFIEIVTTPGGIKARYESEGGYSFDECSVSWADVLEHAPAGFDLDEFIRYLDDEIRQLKEDPSRGDRSHYCNPNQEMFDDYRLDIFEEIRAEVERCKPEKEDE